MRSQQVRPTLGRAASAFALVAIALWLARAPRAHADVGSPEETAPTLHAAEDFGPIAGDKQRVPKPTDQPRTKPGTSSPPSSSSSDDDDGSPSCFDNCFIGTSPAESPQPPPQRVEAIAQTRAWQVGDHGWLRATPPGDSLALRVAAWSPERPDTVTVLLPDGAEVVVVETHALESGLELRVRPVDALSPVGWLGASRVSPERPAPPPARAAAAPAAREAPVRPARPRDIWGAQAVLGGTFALERELAHEYRDGGLHVELDAVRTVGPKASVTAGFGFWSLAGRPDVMYTTEFQWEVPLDSRLELYDLAVQVRYRDGTSRARWLTGIGPAFFLVHERGTIETFTPQMALTGRYRESLVRPAAGIVGHLGGVLRTPGGVEWGLVVSACALPWVGHELKSLTTDFVADGLYQLDVGLTVAYPSH